MVINKWLKLKFPWITKKQTFWKKSCGIDVSQAAASNINTFNTVHFSQIEVSAECSKWARHLKPFRVCVIEQDKMNAVWQTSSISATQKWDDEMHTLLCQHSWRQVFYFESGCSKSGEKVILAEIWNLGVISSPKFTLRSSLLSMCLTVYRHKY